MWDDEHGYDTADPKHPSFAEMWFDHVDQQRKREREQPVTRAYEDVDESAGLREDDAA